MVPSGNKQLHQERHFFCLLQEYCVYGGKRQTDGDAAEVQPV